MADPILNAITWGALHAGISVSRAYSAMNAPMMEGINFHGGIGISMSSGRRTCSASSAKPACLAATHGGMRARAQSPADSNSPQIASPARGAIYTIRLSSPITIDLQATDTSRTLFWFADRGFLGRTESAESLAWAPTQAGRYTVRVLDEAGRSDVRDVSVEIVP